MAEKLTGQDISFLSLQTAVFCVECELISKNNTPCCMAYGSGAVLSLSRVFGGSLRGQQTAHLIADAELDRLVRELLPHRACIHVREPYPHFIRHARAFAQPRLSHDLAPDTRACF
jgi:hypothetical protein